MKKQITENERLNLIALAHLAWEHAMEVEKIGKSIAIIMKTAEDKDDYDTNWFIMDEVYNDKQPDVDQRLKKFEVKVIKQINKNK
jgi:hypothetical protein